MNLLLMFSLIPLIHGAAIPNFPFLSCNTPSFSNDSPYKPSLDSLLSLYSNVTGNVSKFFNMSTGTDSDRVYGLLWCYAYSTDDQCLSCLQVELDHIQKSCMNKYDALVWEEHCLFRYSTQNFFGKLNMTEINPTKNQKNATHPEIFRQIVNKLLLNLTKVAPFAPPSHMYNEGGSFVPPDDMVYAFVECTQDLSQKDCSKCLEYAAEKLLDVYYYARGARLLSYSCFLRYELYRFYDGETESNNSLTIEEKTSKQLKKWLIAAVALGLGILLLSAAGCFAYFIVSRNQKRRENRNLNNQDMHIPGEDDMENRLKKLDPEEFPYIEMGLIEQATDNFSVSSKLGEGGFGPVFKGILSDGIEIAVKRLSSNSRQGAEEFINEVLLIHKLQHINLVRLLGFAVKDDEKMLIYEYMPNGSLDCFLCDLRKRAQLDWRTRVKIINGVARGMLYLHQDSRLKIIHRDLKPSNVLLDAKMNPKISDFGMARILRSRDDEANTARIVGTYGYMAPEFAMEGVYSIKSDVFSFGVLLLEIITGKRNAGFHLTKLAPSLLAYAWKLWEEDKGHELMDRLMGNDCIEQEFLRCLRVGLLCIQADACDRPTMSSVVVMLNEEIVDVVQPKRPGLNVDKFNHHYGTCVDNLSISGLTMSDVMPR